MSRGKMYPLQLYLVTMETFEFVVQRSRSWLQNMVYITLENTWPIRNGSHVHVQRFQDSNEQRDWQLLPQVIDFVNKCEAIFSTKRLKISKCTLIKCLLETNVASSVKPTNVKFYNGYTRPFSLLDSIVGKSVFISIFIYLFFCVCWA